MDSYALSVGIVVGIWVLMALGLNIITGYAGQVSLGHAAFYAFGAYTTAILTTNLGWPWFVTMPLAVVVAAVLGVLLGLPSLRLKEDFLAIVTLGLGLVTQSLALYLPFTGGSLGIGGIPYPSVGGFSFGTDSYFMMVLLFALLGTALSLWLDRSWIGLGWRALRDDELAARSMGIDVTRLKVLAFAIGAGYAGLAGSLLAHHLGFIIAYNFGFNESITALAMIVVGGMGTVRGALVGALLLGLAPELFRPLAEYRMSIYGALIVAVMVFQPGGLLGERSLIARRLRARSLRLRVKHG
ncbi:MAG: branched-chain amino acid ABC transporter permease [Sphingomonadaceae bacterium]